MKRTLALLAGSVLLAGSLTACGSGDDEAGDGGSKTLTVLAAASLTETFDQLKATFEEQHEGVTVKVVYDSSATLATMAEQGAPGDVLATADKATMDKAEAGGGTDGTPTQFASNVLQVAVPAGNDTVASFDDLGKKGVKYVVCVETAPCGAAAKRLLAKNKVTAKPVSEEVDVKSVLGKITSDEVDAGLVYRTDVQAAGDQVTGLDVPGADADPNTYWVSVTKNAESTDLAKQWIDLMTSADGQKVFEAAGFGAPVG